MRTKTVTQTEIYKKNSLVLVNDENGTEKYLRYYKFTDFYSGTHFVGHTKEDEEIFMGYKQIRLIKEPKL